MTTLCRDCSYLGTMTDGICPSCGSVRTLHHPALTGLSVAHLDCDAFYAAIEKRDRPELRAKPVIVGGGRRGVVATCCYIARLSGVRSAMPMFKALKACPDAVVIRPDFARYSAAAKDIRAKLTALTPLVQPVSIDEAYLDLSGTSTLHEAPPAVLLATLARDIETDVGITVSIGLSSNKFLAKTASEMDKPRGFAVLAPDEAMDFLAPHGPNYLHGIGPKLAAKLAHDGYETVADLQQADRKTLLKAYGETGQFLYERCRGIDHRKVVTGGERKSVSSETTFNADISDIDQLTDRLWQVCERTAERAKSAGVEGHTITLKLKSSSFKNITRSTTLPEATQLARTLFDVSRPLLSRAVAGGGSYRLIGVGLSQLETARGDATDLVDPRIAKRAAAERASDTARARFGQSAVKSARAMRLETERKPSSKDEGE